MTRAALVLLIGLLPGLLSAQSLKTSVVRGIPFPEGMRAVASGGGSYIAVGEAGSIYSSSNGTAWTRRETPVRAGLQSAAWTGSAFCVVGNNGTILTSPDGTTWTVRTSGTTLNLAGISSDGGQMVAGSDAGRVISSPDGAAWTAHATPSISRVNSIAYGGSSFVAVTEAGEVLTSSDLVTWTFQASPATGALSSVVFGSGLFVAAGAAGEILTSPDGVAWTIRRSGQMERLWCVVSTPGGFAACGSNGVVLTSPDGISWTASAIAGSPLLSGITQGSGGLVAVTDSGALWTSSDGSAWSLQSAGTRNDLSAAIFGNGLFVAVGTGGEVVTSPDALTWSSQAAGTSDDLHGIAYGAGRFVAVGAGGRIIASTDGVAWSAVASGATARLEAVTYGAGGFVAVGQGGVTLKSADGLSWTSSTVPGVKGDMLSVACGNGTYAAVGQWGQIATSADGNSWTLLPDDPSQKERWYDITGIAFGNGRFVTSTRFNTSFTSTDGTTWTKRSEAMVPGSDFHGTIALPDRLVVLGDLGTIQTSSDGTAWSDQARSSGVRLRGGAFGGGTAVFVGENGAIIVTTRGISAQPQSVSVTEGQTGTLSVVTDGVGPFTCQWYRGTSGDTSSPVVGATGSSLTIDPGVGGAAYWVRVTDGQGSFDSSAAAIIVQAGWTAYHAGWAATGDATYTTTSAARDVVTSLKKSTDGNAAGTATIKYSWTGTYNIRTDNKIGWATGTDAYNAFNGFVGLGTQGDNVSSAGNSTITMGGLSTSKVYEVTVYAGRDTTLFAATNLNVYSLQNATVISTAHSAGVTSTSATSASVAVGLGCKAAGRVVRWTFQPTSPSVVLQTAVGGGAANSVIPQAIRLVELSETPVVTSNPSSTTASAGSNLTLTPQVAGSGMTYQWFKRDVDGNVTGVSGATGASLAISSLSESAQYFLRATGSGGSVDTAPATVIAKRTYDAWVVSQSLLPDREAADDDADGLPNLVEYALGTNPNAASSVPTVSVNAMNRLALTYRKSREIEGVSIVPEMSSTLVSGSWLTASVVQQQLGEENFATETWEASVPVGTPRTFLRLRILRQP